MTITYGNGIGDTTGDTLATCKPLMASGNVWYVNSVGGVDAASPAGQNASKPLATLQQAHTNAADNDIIFLQPGHTQIFTTFLSVTKKVTIIGGGQSNGLPTVKLFNNSAGVEMLSLLANVELRNIWFPSNMQPNSQDRVDTNADGYRIIGCYFECGANDLGPALLIASGNNGRIVNTTFISTATAVTAQPLTGISVTAAISDLEMDGVVFSGGTVGFSNYRAFDGTSGVITRLRATRISLLLGADIKLASASTGYLNVQTAQNGSRVDW